MSLPSRDLRWYLLHCKPRQDGRAIENLQRQGFECFGPARPVERLRDGRRCSVMEPLFPGYLFIHLDPNNDNWGALRSTRGVDQIVRFNEYPLPIRNELISDIRSRLAQSIVEEPYLKPGERVRITGGPFAQLEAIFVANDGDQRVILLLNILAKDQQLSFPLQSVRKLA
jgi:transcriptional antiterminator RfaH